MGLLAKVVAIKMPTTIIKTIEATRTKVTAVVVVVVKVVAVVTKDETTVEENKITVEAVEVREMNGEDAGVVVLTIRKPSID